MSYEVPSVQSLAERAGAAIRAALPGSDTTPRRNNLAVVGKVLALLLHEVHLRIAYLWRQRFTATADGAHLDEHAASEGLSRKPASRATGSLTATGTAAGVVYPSGLRWKAGVVTLEATAAATANGAGTATIAVRAVEPGAAGNLVAGQAAALLDPGSWLTLAPTATVATGGLGGGADIEADEALRDRILERKRNPPQGGSVTDYQRMALDVAGVTRAFAAQGLAAPGSVFVWFLFAGRVNGIPEAGDVAAVQAHLEARRRIVVEVTAVAPVAQAVPITITGLVPDNAAVRAAIEASIRAVFADRAEPGRPGQPFVFSRSWIIEAISTAAGEARHELTLPANSVSCAAGVYPVPGTITFA